MLQCAKTPFPYTTSVSKVSAVQFAIFRRGIDGLVFGVDWVEFLAAPEGIFIDRGRGRNRAAKRAVYSDRGRKQEPPRAGNMNQQEVRESSTTHAKPAHPATINITSSLETERQSLTGVIRFVFIRLNRPADKI
jgi:hypothetical protein